MNFSGSNGSRSSDLLADPDVADGQVQLARDGDHDAALGGAVELGQHDAGDAGGLGELARLLQAVLAGGGVQHQQHFVRRVGDHASCAVRLIFSSSAIRFSLVCRRPAVSTMT